MLAKETKGHMNKRNEKDIVTLGKQTINIVLSKKQTKILSY